MKDSLKSGSLSSFFTGSSESLTDYKEIGNINDLFTHHPKSEHFKSNVHSTARSVDADFGMSNANAHTSSTNVNVLDYLNVKKQNDELLYINSAFKDELERLSSQITLMERKQVSYFYYSRLTVGLIIFKDSNILKWF